MIELSKIKEGVHMDHRFVSPTVYLDHWAWRKISESEMLTNRFSNALKSRGGTLAISWLNLVEFSKVTCEQQTCKADVLLDKILPQVFFLNPNFFKVIEHEDKPSSGSESITPHEDSELLKGFVKLNLLKSNSLKLLPAQTIFRLVPATGIAGQYDPFADLIINYIKSLRRDYNSDKKFQVRVNQLPKGRQNQYQYGTRFIANELFGSFLKDKRIEISRNHAIDVSHAVVPVAYCNYVLLDGHWATQVERAKKRITDGGLSFSMAKTFSGKANGMEKFLQELESGGQ
jgi:hypothetical protein